MKNLYETIKNIDEIKASQNIFCPECGEKQFAILDKLYCNTYGICIDCEDVDLLEEKSEQIFQIL